jgi:hypothetical protein
LRFVVPNLVDKTSGICANGIFRIDFRMLSAIDLRILITSGELQSSLNKNDNLLSVDFVLFFNQSLYTGYRWDGLRPGGLVHRA